MDGLIERHRLEDEIYEEESWSSESCGDLCGLICPTLRSYCSLETLSCSDLDDDECRFVKLNNVVKKLVDIIGDPVDCEDVKTVCCLLCKLLEYNGFAGYATFPSQRFTQNLPYYKSHHQYVCHLPQIGEILEFISMRVAKGCADFASRLADLLRLCSLRPRLRRSSEALTCQTNLGRHFSLLGYLLALTPTRQHFLQVADAIEQLLLREENSEESSRGGSSGGRRRRKSRSEGAKGRRDEVRLESLRDAARESRLPLTLVELVEVANADTYPRVLSILLALSSAASGSRRRISSAGIESLILSRMHPAYERGFECPPITDDTDLRLDRQDHYEAVEDSVKLLYQLLTSMIMPTEQQGNAQKPAPPNKIAMRSLQAAFRREVVLAGGSARARNLRNKLAGLVLLGSSLGADSWQLGDSFVGDLVHLAAATELDARDSIACGWSGSVRVETLGPHGLAFKQILLVVVALVAEADTCCADALKNKGIMCAVLQLINPDTRAARMDWNDEQLWHLFKYASNALTYLAPKIPEEFVEHNGSQRLLLSLERLLKVDRDNALITCLLEAICSLTSSNCRSVLDDFRKCDFVPVLLQFVQSISPQILSTTTQKTITLVLIICENIVEDQACLRECYCDLAVKTAVDLLTRSLNQGPNDSELKTSFLVAIASFIWKCLIDCPDSLNIFLSQGGIYLILDVIYKAVLTVQNFFLGVLLDICGKASCIKYLLTWRRSNKSHGLLSLLAKIWRKEERFFRVHRSREGCIQSMDSPVLNDEAWIYSYFVRSNRKLSPVVTTAVGPARPKIHHLYKLIQESGENQTSDDLNTCVDEIPLEDQITLLTVAAYENLKADEATLEVGRATLDLLPVTAHKSHQKTASLGSPDSKLAGWASKTRSAQLHLLARRRDQDELDEARHWASLKSARLEPAFDALSELGFVARTSCGGYRQARVAEMLKQVDEEESAWQTTRVKRGSDEVVVRRKTFCMDAKVTNVFNQRMRIKSLPETCKCETDNNLVSISSLPIEQWPSLSRSQSSCSLATIKSDSSFLYKTYGFDANGNVICGDSVRKKITRRRCEDY